jgi:hypothetical protein
VTETKTRVCEICGAAAPFRKKGQDPSDVAIISITATIYRNGAAGRQLATCERTAVCESCLESIRPGTAAEKWDEIAGLILARAGRLYNTLLEQRGSDARRPQMPG